MRPRDGCSYSTAPNECNTLFTPAAETKGTSKMASTPKILYEKHGQIAQITLNRPEVKNALDLEMHERLVEIWEDFQDDENLRVAVITGTGDAFCAGADLKSHLPMWAGADAGLPLRKLNDGFGGITRGLHRIHKPIVAAVNGWALGGGLEIALACDIRIATTDARFGCYEVRRGLNPMDGGIVRLVNMCGLSIALDILLTGDSFDAEQARRWQLVSRVVAPEDLAATTDAVTAAILRNDRVAIEMAKSSALDVIGRRLDDALQVEALVGYALVASNPTVKGRLEAFYDRSDYDRVEPGPATP